MKQILKIPKEHPVIGPALHAGFQSFQCSPAVIASDRLLFMAGQVGIGPDGAIPEDPLAQADILLGLPEHAVIDEIERLKPDNLAFALQELGDLRRDELRVNVLQRLQQGGARGSLEQDRDRVLLPAGAWTFPAAFAL